MSDAPHLLVAVSAHGFGHLAQCAPVVNALRARLPGMRLTVRSGLAPEYLASRLQGPFQVDPRSDDFGVCNRGALAVDLEATAARYRDLHREWPQRVAEVARELRRSAPDLLLADIPYLTLAAAQRAGIPNLALCSLHWGDIYWQLLSHLQEAPDIRARIMAAYAGADCFLRPAPAMPMDGLDNLRDIGPIAAVGRNRRPELARRLGLGADDRLVILSMGGHVSRLPIEVWPLVPGLHWLVPRSWEGERGDLSRLQDLGLPFGDLLASCDALVCKPGYGSFVEAAASGIPVLYVRRDDWPEQNSLLDWLHRHTRCVGVSRQVFESEELIGPLLALLVQGPYPPIRPNGAEEAAALILSRLA